MGSATLGGTLHRSSVCPFEYAKQMAYNTYSEGQTDEQWRVACAQMGSNRGDVRRWVRTEGEGRREWTSQTLTDDGRKPVAFNPEVCGRS
jgi:hypothetical protein